MPIPLPDPTLMDLALAPNGAYLGVLSTGGTIAAQIAYGGTTQTVSITGTNTPSVDAATFSAAIKAAFPALVVDLFFDIIFGGTSVSVTWGTGAAQFAGFVGCVYKDGTGDLAIQGDDLAMTSGLAAIAQEARARFNLWVGEWFLNPAEGLPFLQNIVGRLGSVDDIAYIFRGAVALIPGVIQVKYLTLAVDRAARTLTVNWAAQCKPGLLVSVDFQPFIVPLSVAPAASP